MKTSPSSTAQRILGLLSILLLSVLGKAQTAAISIDRTNYFSQTNEATVPPHALPFSLNFHIRGGTTDMNNWGPAFYIPGSGGIPQSGSSSATNTGTLNFSSTPNNGGSFMFIHDFATNAEMESFYPIAPTDGGVYGIEFLGSVPPSPDMFADGLVFAAGTTYPSVTPQITSVDNDAIWASNALRIKPTGTTTVTFNTFPEYSSTTYGSFIAVGIYSNTDGVVDEASAESYYLPMGDSSEPPVVPVNQPALTHLAIDGSWLTPGATYTMELQYAVLSGQPEEADLNGQEFQGLATYRKLTTISIRVDSEVNSDFNVDGKPDTLWQNTVTGERGLFLMNGTSLGTWAPLGYFGANYDIAAIADFNSDGKPDTVWQNTATGERGIYLMDGTTFTSWVPLGYFNTAYDIVGAADFNGDGKPDTVWQNIATGERGIYLMDGTTFTSWVPLGYFGTAYRIAVIADFNDDGKPDTVWQNTVTGERGIYLMDGTTFTSWVPLGYFSTNYVIVAAADYNADGKTDTVWQNTATGECGIYLMNGTNFSSWIPLGYFSTQYRIAH